MINTFFNWIKLDAQNLIVEVWWVSLILWILLLLAGISDIATNTLTKSSKAAWMATIVLVPMIGLFTYCIFCLTRADYHWLEFLLMKRKGSRRKGSKASVSSS